MLWRRRRSLTAVQQSDSQIGGRYADEEQSDDCRHEQGELQKAIDAYAGRTGMRAGDWLTLVRAGVFPGVPFDPTGTLYTLDAGRAKVAQSSRLWPMPEEPQRADSRPPS